MDSTDVVVEAQRLLATGQQTLAADILEKHLTRNGTEFIVLRMLAQMYPFSPPAKNPSKLLKPSGQT